MLNDFSKRNLMWLWNSLHQTTETFSYKTEAAETAMYCFRDTSCALHRQNLCHQAIQWSCQLTLFVGLTGCWRYPQFIQYHRSPGFPVPADNGTFQGPGWLTMCEASACPNPICYWLSSGAARRLYQLLLRHAEECKCPLCGCRSPLIDNMEIWPLHMTTHQSFSDLNRHEFCHPDQTKPHLLFKQAESAQCSSKKR